MSQQFNFFAINNDQKLICETIVSTLGKIYVIPERGAISEMAPQPVMEPDDLRANRISSLACIVKEDFLHLLKLREISGDLYRIDFRGFPCLEYSPSIQISHGVVKVGRIAYFFVEYSSFKTEVQKLIRLLKKKSLKLKGKKNFWIFERTAQDTEKLQYWVGSPKINPMYVISGKT